MNKFIFVVSVLLLSPVLRAECYTHVVVEEETYTSIAQKYLGSGYYWWYFKLYSEHRRDKAERGERIDFYLPTDQSDWIHGCRLVLARRLVQVGKVKHLDSILYAVPYGIHLATKVSGQNTVDPMIGLDLCLLSAAVAEHVSEYNPNKVVKERVGLLQVDISTGKSIMAANKELYSMVFSSEQEGVEFLKSPVVSTAIFVISYVKYLSEHKVLHKALFKYLGTVDDAIAVMGIYAQIRNIKPFYCTAEEKGE